MEVTIFDQSFYLFLQDNQICLGQAAGYQIRFICKHQHDACLVFVGNHTGVSAPVTQLLRLGLHQSCPLKCQQTAYFKIFLVTLQSNRMPVWQQPTVVTPVEVKAATGSSSVLDVFRFMLLYHRYKSMNMPFLILA